MIATRSSAELPSDAYWFEEAEASDPLSEITESECTAGSIASVHTSNDDVIVDLKGTKYAAQVTLEGAAALSMRQSGNTLIATRSSAEAYWFEEAEASDPLSEITESDAAVELQFDDLKDALAATPEIAVIARKQSRSGRIS